MNKSEIIDISVSLSEQLPTWPGGHGFHKHKLMSISEGDEANVTRLDFDVHSGTHIDAPLHFVENGKMTVDLPLDWLIGECLVLQFSELHTITAEDLEAKAVPQDIERILLKTDNSDGMWHRNPFNVNFVAIDHTAAEWIARRKMKLIGIDAPSIQKFHHSCDTHVTLLQNNVIILEGLDLANVDEGKYKLICLPIKADGCEGITARAILKKK